LGLTNYKPMQNRTRQFRPGFTLVEILCVVIILAIIAAMALPSAATAAQSGDAAAAARTLMADLLYAQSRAISTHTCHYVIFDSSNNSYSVQYNTGTSITCVTDPTTGLSSDSANNLSRLCGATIASFDVGSNGGIVFDAMGIPYAYNPAATTPALYQGSALSAPGTIVIQSGGTSLTITIDNDNGAISVQ
jgi:prepilin-type N-terminal cleavage/methylation domain-containing protein